MSPVEIRSALASDIPAIAKAHLESSKIAYRGILHPAVLDGLSPEGRIALWETRFAGIGPRARLWIQCIGSEVIGFALSDAVDDGRAAPSVCELKSFYLSPHRWGAGLGASLLAHVVADFKDRDFHSMILWTIRLNARARQFYERKGFSCDGVTRLTARRESGQPLEYEEIRYSRRL
jgi:GNAT superfamily N-acetyltransferase